MTYSIVNEAELGAADRALAEAARAATERAYAPYSRFHVGAAGLFEDGTLLAGANFENASYGLSLCAETVLIARANAEGRLAGLRAIAVTARGDVAGLDADGVGEFVTPCGRCRQVLAEAARIAGQDIAVLLVAPRSERVLRTSARALLPLAFGLDSGTDATSHAQR